MSIPLRSARFRTLLTSSSSSSSFYRKSFSSTSTSCPISYGYNPKTLAKRLPSYNLTRDTVLYVVGGMYGNKYALDEVIRMASLENVNKAKDKDVVIVFNGDFNFLNSDCKTFEYVNNVIFSLSGLPPGKNMTLIPTKGNIEEEISKPPSSIYEGCGCAYPEYVNPEAVARSDDIVFKLKSTADLYPDIQKQLKGLPNGVRFNCKTGTNQKEGDSKTITILHGDTNNLSGWSLSVENIAPRNSKLLEALNISLDNPLQDSEEMEGVFEEIDSDIICTTHTCLAFAQSFNGGSKLLFNNGSAGIPNFRNSTYGKLL